MKFRIVLFLALVALMPFTPTLAQEQDKDASHAESSNASSPSQSPTTSSTGAAHATTGVEPGSHEDWCSEHEVPESQCTRCNKELIPAFKASNDWCAEHGLPESQCRACNPKLEIKRPAGGK